MTGSRFLSVVLVGSGSLVLMLPGFHHAASGAENAKGPAQSTDTLPPQASLPAPGPEKGGLAALYPGDEGIERDPRVPFVDDFETGTVAEIGARWGNVRKRENIRLSAGDSP